jgi:hypothetical protein
VFYFWTYPFTELTPVAPCYAPGSILVLHTLRHLVHALTQALLAHPLEARSDAGVLLRLSCSRTLALRPWTIAATRHLRVCE